MIKTNEGKIFIYNKNEKIRIQDKSNSILFKDVFYDAGDKLISSHNNTLFHKKGIPIALELAVGDKESCVHFLIVVNKNSFMKMKDDILGVIEDEMLEVVFFDEEDLIEVLI